MTFLLTSMKLDRQAIWVNSGCMGFFKPTWAKILLTVLLIVLLGVLAAYEHVPSLIDYPPGIAGSLLKIFGVSYYLVVIVSLTKFSFLNTAADFFGYAFVLFELYIISCCLVFSAQIFKNLFFKIQSK